MLDINSNIQFLMRWFHFIFGILWIGHLYFFNFVNGVVMKTLDGPTKQKVVPELMPRALWWFRWGALVTWFTGVGQIVWKYWIASDGGWSAFMGSTWGQWISLGAVFGTVMFINVWCVIWPAQKEIIAAVKAGQTPNAAKAERARKASKLNTFLSIPLLFAMGAASHYPLSSPVVMVVAIAGGFIIAHGFYKMSLKVGKL